jgi:hypothetical protein
LVVPAAPPTTAPEAPAARPAPPASAGSSAAGTTGTAGSSAAGTTGTAGSSAAGSGGGGKAGGGGSAAAGTSGTAGSNGGAGGHSNGGAGGKADAGTSMADCTVTDATGTDVLTPAIFCAQMAAYCPSQFTTESACESLYTGSNQEHCRSYHMCWGVEGFGMDGGVGKPSAHCPHTIGISLCQATDAGTDH